MSIGNLWSGGECKVLDGTVIFPQDIPAGTSLGMTVAAHKTRKKDLVRWEVQLDWIFTPPEVKPLTALSDLYYRGEQMSQFFKPPRPSNRRNKILIWGPSGVAKTLSALSFPKCAYIDNHKSSDPYRVAYPEHLYADVINADRTMEALQSLFRDPEDRKTVVIDDLTIYGDKVKEKWHDNFLKRLPNSPGHHAEFYTFQPSDHIHPKREIKNFILRMLSLDMNVIAIARSAPLYKGSGKDFMEKIGESFGGDQKLVHEFDFNFEFQQDTQGNRKIIVHKFRITPGKKPLPREIEFTVDSQGKSNFFEIFKEYVDLESFTQPVLEVHDPVMEELTPVDQASAAPPEQTMPPAGNGNGGNGNGSQAIPKPATQNQFVQIKNLKDALSFNKETWTTYLLENFGVDSATKLTFDDASKLIDNLDGIPF